MAAYYPSRSLPSIRLSVCSACPCLFLNTDKQVLRGEDGEGTLVKTCPGGPVASATEGNMTVMGEGCLGMRDTVHLAERSSII